MEDRIEEVARAVPGKWPTSTVGTVSARSEAKNQDARTRVAERRNGAAPVFPIGVGAAANLRDMGAVAAEAFATFAGHDFCIEQFKSMGAARHREILVLRSISVWQTWCEEIPP